MSVDRRYVSTQTMLARVASQDTMTSHPMIDALMDAYWKSYTERLEPMARRRLFDALELLAEQSEAAGSTSSEEEDTALTPGKM